MFSRRTRSVAAAGALLIAGGLAATVPASASSAGTAKVSALHGIPGVPAAAVVDVYAGDQELIPDFTPGTLAGPLDVPAYDIGVYADGQGPGNGDAILSLPGTTLPAGADATVVAHLDEAGSPAIKAFVNDTSALEAGKARVTVRHVAAAPAVDILAGGAVVAPGLTNPNEASLVVDAGTISASVALAGTTDPVLGPADLQLAEGTNTIVYAYGSASGGTLALATQTITGLHSSPSGVPGGEAGLAADNGAPSAWLLAAALLGVVGVTGAALTARRHVAARASSVR